MSAWSKWRNRVVGTAVGGPVGYAIGDYLDRSKERDSANPYAAEEKALAQTQRQRADMEWEARAAAGEYGLKKPENIERQYSINKAPIEQQYKSARSNMLSDLNRRGMLKSGRAQTLSAELEGARTAGLMGARANAIADIENRHLAMETDPLQSYANIQEQNQSFNQQLNQNEMQRQNFINQLQGQSMGYLGSGLGTGLSNMSAGKKFGYVGY